MTDLKENWEDRFFNLVIEYDNDEVYYSALADFVAQTIHQEIDKAVAEEREKNWEEGYLVAMQRIQGCLSRIGKEEGEEGQIMSSIDNAKFFVSDGIRNSQIRLNQLKEEKK